MWQLHYKVANLRRSAKILLAYNSLIWHLRARLVCFRESSAFGMRSENSGMLMNIVPAKTSAAARSRADKDRAGQDWLGSHLSYFRRGR